MAVVRCRKCSAVVTAHAGETIEVSYGASFESKCKVPAESRAGAVLPITGCADMDEAVRNAAFRIARQKRRRGAAVAPAASVVPADAPVVASALSADPAAALLPK
jgi:hypothetical protein